MHSLLGLSPARTWEDAFLSGNGEVGIMAYGGPREELVVNHHRFVLPNGTRDRRPPAIAHLLPEIRAHVLAGRPVEAQALAADGWSHRAFVSRADGVVVQRLTGDVALRLTGDLPGKPDTVRYETAAVTGAAEVLLLTKAVRHEHPAWPDDERIRAGDEPDGLAGLLGPAGAGYDGLLDRQVARHRGQIDHWRTNAREIYGARGILAPSRTDGENGHLFHLNADWPWTMWLAGADWLLYPLVEHAVVTGEPIPELAGRLAESRLFWEDFLAGTDGTVVPSFSPEVGPGGGPFACHNATMDVAAARHALGEEDHRHVSHLYPVRARQPASGAGGGAVEGWRAGLGKGDRRAAARAPAGAGEGPRARRPLPGPGDGRGAVLGRRRPGQAHLPGRPDRYRCPPCLGPAPRS